MATTPGYDPKKAASYNKLRQLGLSEDQAARQAGISEAEDRFYEVSDVGSSNPNDASFNPNRGKMGPPVQGAQAAEYNKAIASGKTEEQAFAELEARRVEAKAERAASRDEDDDEDELFERSPVAINEKTPPDTKVTPINYTTTSTETVSGGGSTNTVAGAPQPTPASRSLQPDIDAKQAEQTEFIKNNPSDFARRKQGLPPLSPEEKQQREEKLAQLSAEKEALVRKQENSEAPGATTVTTVPNTTITTKTVTSGTTSTDRAVDFNNDQQLSQQTETQIDARTPAPNADTAAAPAAVPANQSLGPGEEIVTGPPLSDPGGVLAAEDAAIAQQAAAQGDADAFANASTVRDPAGVLAAEDAAIAAQEAAQGDAAAFDGASTIREPTGVLAAEDAALAEQAAAQGDADAFASAGTIREPTGVLAAEDAAIAAQQAAQGDADAFAGLGTAPLTADELAARQAATLDKARAQNTIANQRSNKNNADWRVKLRLAPLADYLYMAKPPGILAPLAPDGVIFPYTPTIQTSYKATYATTDITHSNYRGYFYQGSAVEPFTIGCTFTAQSTAEAEYLLAVIHFFKSVTKMFYGQDPQRGTPPPLVYLTGLGEFQFNEHPCVVSGFTYDLPADVDYIRAYSPNVNNSNMLQQRQSNNSTGPGTSWGNGILGGVLGGAVNRLASSKLFNGQPLPKGGQNIPPAPQTLGSNTIPTYVPTKMTISISLLPVVSRQAQSQRFSVRQYATGDLLKGGMW